MINKDVSESDLMKHLKLSHAKEHSNYQEMLIHLKVKLFNELIMLLLYPLGKYWLRIFN